MGFDLFSHLSLRRPDSVFSPLSLRQNFLWTLLGNVGYAASRWLVLVILAKVGSAEMIGDYALGMAICLPVLAFTDLQLQTIMVTDVKGQHVFGDYLGLNLLTTLAGLLVILGIVATLGYGREKNLVILLVALDRAVWSVSYIFYGLFQQHERMDFISISTLLKSGLSLSLMGLMAYLTGSIVWICLGLAVSSMIAFFSFDFRKGFLFTRLNPAADPGGGEARRAPIILRPRWLPQKFLKLAWVAFPLGCVFGLLSLNNNIPRFFIEKYLGARELGIFAAAYAPASGGRFIISALGNSASRRLAKHFTLGDRKAFVSLLVKLGGIGALIGAAGIGVAALAGKEILVLLYRPEYGEYAGTFLWLMVATGVYYLAAFMGQGMTAARQFWAQLPLLVTTGLVSALACYHFVPTHGVTGAAISEVITQAAAFTGCLIIILYTIKYKLKLSPD